MECLYVDAEVVSGCRIQEQHKSPYVTALLSQPVPSYGCVSRELVPTTQQQVDVLLFNVSSSPTTNSVNRQHMSAAWSTNGRLRQHIYLTLKQSVNYGMIYVISVIYLRSRFLTESYIIFTARCFANGICCYSISVFFVFL